MVIAIDYTPAYEQGAGIGRLVRNQIQALADYDRRGDYRLFVAGSTGDDLPALPGKNFTWVTTPVKAVWLARIWRTPLPLPINWITGNIDLYHATNFMLPPLSDGIKSIVTVHDLSFIKTPEAAPLRLRTYLNKVVPESINRASHIIADSTATKQDMMELYQTPADKISVVLSAVESRFVPVTACLMTTRNKYHLPESPFLFSIGTVQPRKNYSRVIKTLSILREKGYDISLVIAGGKGWLEDEMYSVIAETNMQDYVHLIGYADDDDLPALYSMAECVVFPSLYEGFGFPVLEGMACGTPVITSNVSSMPEVAGDAALLINPLDTDELTDTIRRVLDDTELREKMIQRGLQQVKTFNPENTAKQLLHVYTKTLRES